MNEKIIPLGTYGSDAVRHYGLSSSSFFLKLGNHNILLDPGPGSLIKLSQLKLPKPDIILVSHNHLAHCNDLNLAIDFMTLSGVEKRGVVIGDETTIEGDSREESFLTRSSKHYPKKIISITSGDEVNLGDLRIKATKTLHSEKSVGYKLTTENLSLTYTSDTAYSKELLKDYQNSDVLIINNVSSFGKISKENLSSDDSVSIISTIQPKMAILSHFGSSFLRINPLYEARDIRKNVPSDCNVVCARSGVEIEPILSSHKQKMITGY